MKDSALVIQSAYRGWVVRRKYTKLRKGEFCPHKDACETTVCQTTVCVRPLCVRPLNFKFSPYKGVVAVQSLYKMKRQQAIYGEMKTELQRRKEIEDANRTSRQVSTNVLFWITHLIFFS